MAHEDLRTLRDFATELAWNAGRVTLRHFQTNVVAELKADNSPVTIADRESERLMRELIEARYPHHSILGEEEGETRPGASFRWILDPIDGTKSFVAGVPMYAVLVGLERDGVPVVGAVAIPPLGEMLTAAHGEGCLWNGRVARVSSTPTLADAVISTTDVRHMREYGRDAAFERLSSRTRMLRGWGDAYGHVLVATGRIDVMLDAVMSPWDCAALVPVIQEAGGTFTDWDGVTTIYGGGAISTNGTLFPQVMQTIREQA
ncbi:MAG: histidinol-phosphatase [Roseiflexaceae bacterium]|jgi:histidinol-phosphatase|nr:histidinol-phosphatase [Chloroflexaceae bacterium]MCE2852113.1 histidinol-phosphatase [Chloroflexaceae bacterium]